MLDINPDVVCFLIEKARGFHAQEAVVIPEVPGSPSDDWALQVLANHVDDETYLEFKATFEDLDPDQQQTVVALMWLGRGDYALDEWDAALEDAESSWTGATADYLIAHPLLADYLQDGLDQHGYRCDE